MSDLAKDLCVSEQEEQTLAFWKEHSIFEKSVSMRPEDNRYVFYDGPPFISGLPHHGSFVASIAKDVVPRYWTMKGKRIERVWGWDAHGLTVENKVQQKLDIKDRRDIEKFGLAEFTQACYQYTSETSAAWPWYIDRIGRWVDMEHAYKTIDQTYMESVMWAFKQLYDKGYIYEGLRTSLYCTTCGTPVSNFEVAMDDTYKEVEDPAITVKFKILSDSEYKDAYVLAWTTTPWTMPSNRALVLDEAGEYALVEFEGEKYIVGSARISEVFKDKTYQVLKTFLGKELLGLKYQPPYTFYLANDKDFTIYSYVGMVSSEEGTGVVHCAPGFGAIDTQMGYDTGLTIMTSIDDEGKFTQGTNGDNPYAGLYYKKSNPLVIDDLQKRNLLFENTTIVHRFPYHDRCNTLLIQRAQNSWFLRETSMTEELLKNNEPINWVPDHLKEGLFTHVIKTAPDWCISRNRYWATPMPVWESSDGDRIVIGSIKELEELSGQKVKDLHRPYIDEIVFTKDGKEYCRRPEVLDSWFEAGSMPFAQWHYPFENKEKFENNFPGDFIVEYIAQTRAWFRVMHVISVGIFGTNAFKNVISTGVLAGNDGRKMSKTYANYTDPKEVLQTTGGDALRLYLMNSPIMSGGGVNFDFDAIKIKSRNVINPLWNSLKFLLMHIEGKSWKYDATFVSDNILDKWIMIRLNQLIQGFSENIEKYEIAPAVQFVEDFVDDLSRWYVRRSRERIASFDISALNTLFTVLYKFSLAAAPITPFLSERVYQALVPYMSDTKESVHLEFYPAYEKVSEQDLTVLTNMTVTRDIVSLALAVRTANNIKVRQPLGVLNVKTKSATDFVIYEDLVKDEVNVKEIKYAEDSSLSQLYTVDLDTTITDELKIEGNARDFIRAVQDLRKEKGYSLQDKVKVTYPDSEENQKVLELFEEYLKNKTSAESFTPGLDFDVIKV